MKSAQELLTTLRQSGAETSHIEAKEAAWLESNTKSVYETICAFANEPFQNGGYLLLGVTEHEKGSFEVTGVIDADKLQRDLTTACRGDRFSSAINIECVPQTLNGKSVLAVYVPEAYPPHYPVWLKDKKGSSVFRRRNSSDVRCSYAEINELIQCKNSALFDASINTHASMADLDTDTIHKFRSILADKSPNMSSVQYSNEELLISLNYLCKKDGIFYPNNAGLLLFGTSMALRRFFPMFRIDYLTISEAKQAEDADARYEKKMTFRENLISLAETLLDHIRAQLPTRPVFNKDKIQRKDEPLLPNKALREAIVNMLMHQDFQKHTPIQIRNYSNRIELENPGYSLRPLEGNTTRISVPRNPTITAAFHEINYAETLGSGIESMKQYMREAGLKTPEFISDREGNLFRCTFSLHHFLKDEDITWLRQFSNMLNENQIRALIEIRQTGKIDNTMYCIINNLGADDKKARKELHDLCKKNILIKTGKNRWTTYTLVEPIVTLSSLSGQEEQDKLLLVNSDDKEKITCPEEVVPDNSISSLSPLSGQEEQDKLLPVNSHDKEKITCSEEVVPDNSISSLSDKEGQVPPKSTVDKTSRNKKKKTNFGGLNKEEIIKRLGALSDKAEKESFYDVLSRHVVEKILQQCTLAPHKAKDLASVAGVNTKRLKKEFLAPLLSEGKLLLLYPDTPNHPKQAYITPDYVKNTHE